MSAPVPAEIIGQTQLNVGGLWEKITDDWMVLVAARPVHIDGELRWVWRATDWTHRWTGFATGLTAAEWAAFDALTGAVPEAYRVEKSEFVVGLRNESSH